MDHETGERLKRCRGLSKNATSIIGLQNLELKKQDTEISFWNARRRCTERGFTLRDFEDMKRESTKFLEPYILRANSTDESLFIFLEKMKEFWDTKWIKY